MAISKVMLAQVPSSSSLNGAGTFTTLPSDLVFKILCLLDYDVLIQKCRSVCRQWKAIVDIVPSKIAIPIASWKPVDLFSEKERFTPKTMLSAATVLANGSCQRYKKALNQKPEKEAFEFSDLDLHLEVESRVKQHSFESGAHGKPDCYYHVLKNLVIRTEANFQHISPASRNFYIEIWKAEEGRRNQISRMKFSNRDGMILNDLQYLLCEDLLLARIGWVSGMVQVIVCQYITSNCIFDSREIKEDCALLKACGECRTLLFLEVKPIPHNGISKKILRLGLVDDSRRKILQYNLDVTPGAGLISQ